MRIRNEHASKWASGQANSDQIVGKQRANNERIARLRNWIDEESWQERANNETCQWDQEILCAAKDASKDFERTSDWKESKRIHRHVKFLSTTGIIEGLAFSLNWSSFQGHRVMKSKLQFLIGPIGVFLIDPICRLSMKVHLSVNRYLISYHLKNTR